MVGLRFEYVMYFVCVSFVFNVVYVNYVCVTLLVFTWVTLLLIFHKIAFFSLFLYCEYEHGFK